MKCCGHLAFFTKLPGCGWSLPTPLLQCLYSRVRVGYLLVAGIWDWAGSAKVLPLGPGHHPRAGLDSIMLVRVCPYRYLMRKTGIFCWCGSSTSKSWRRKKTEKEAVGRTANCFDTTVSDRQFKHGWGSFLRELVAVFQPCSKDTSSLVLALQLRQVYLLRTSPRNKCRLSGGFPLTLDRASGTKRPPGPWVRVQATI
jgi:hypothetical protein